MDVLGRVQYIHILYLFPIVAIHMFGYMSSLAQVGHNPLSNFLAHRPPVMTEAHASVGGSRRKASYISPSGPFKCKWTCTGPEGGEVTCHRHWSR